MFLLMPIVGLLLGATLAGIAAWHVFSNPRSQWLGPALIRGAHGQRRIALTLDDGPSPITPAVLDVLQKYGVPAAFFVCGRNAERHPQVIARMREAGHLVGNHSYSHPYLYFLPRPALATELDRAQQAIEAAGGATPAMFRPPYGARWFGLYPLLRKRGMSLVNWSIATDEWSLNGSQLARSLTDALHPGAILLLHDGHQSRQGMMEKLKLRPYTPADPGQPPVHAKALLEALPLLIESAREAGYQWVRLDAIAGPDGARPKL
jgi:peptidoglycan/xylan/chitin deacetylase (PgdA/CDA1 family)